MHYFSPYAALEESVAELPFSNLHKIITKPFSVCIENISIFKLPHEALNAVSLRQNTFQKLQTAGSQRSLSYLGSSWVPRLKPAF